MAVQKLLVAKTLWRFPTQTAALGGSSKQLFDMSLALLLLVAMSPLLLFVAAIIVLNDGRPFFIRHNRVGHGGREFACLKFRTMVTDAGERLRLHLAQNPEAANEWRTSRKLREDPRITPVGQALRKSSLDEMLQLINIVRGEMSFVGPRPIVRDEAVHYGAHFEEYTSTRPGLTGLWQISGRSDTTYDERVQLDCMYVRGWSFQNDIRIIVRTIPAVLGTRGSV